MLVECGFVRATVDDGQGFTFYPSFGRIAALGSPQEIVELYAALHGPEAEAEAAYVLAGLCDQDDPTPLIGGEVLKIEFADGVRNVTGERITGAMPAAEQIIVARHLLRHGMVGTARPGAGGGQYSERFDAADYIAAASVHLGLSDADAKGLSMTDFQRRFAMKFPEIAKKNDLPTREEYHASKARFREMAAKRGARRG